MRAACGRDRLLCICTLARHETQHFRSGDSVRHFAVFEHSNQRVLTPCSKRDLKCMVVEDTAAPSVQNPRQQLRSAQGNLADPAGDNPMELDVREVRERFLIDTHRTIGKVTCSRVLLRPALTVANQQVDAVVVALVAARTQARLFIVDCKQREQADGCQPDRRVL